MHMILFIFSLLVSNYAFAFDIAFICTGIKGSSTHFTMKVNGDGKAEEMNSGKKVKVEINDLFFLGEKIKTEQVVGTVGKSAEGRHFLVIIEKPLQNLIKEIFVRYGGNGSITGAKTVDFTCDVSPKHKESTAGKMRADFWKTFREAFLNKDFTNLENLSEFPIAVAGELDDAPILKLSQKKFKDCFSLIYNRDTGLNVKPTSHLDYIKSTDSIPEKAQTNELSFRIADLQFKIDKGSYKLIKFYLDTSEPTVVKNCK